MTEARIIVAESHGHWNAWFEDRPFEAFGGDTPGTSVERLWEAELNNRAAKQQRQLDQEIDWIKARDDLRIEVQVQEGVNTNDLKLED